MIPPFPRGAELGGVAVAELAERFGTPPYAVDHAELAGGMAEYTAAFGRAVVVTHAAEALCVVGVLQLAVEHGPYVDVASAGELHAAARGRPVPVLLRISLGWTPSRTRSSAPDRTAASSASRCRRSTHRPGRGSWVRRVAVAQR